MNGFKALWTIGGIAASIVTAIITTTLYVNGLISKIDKLETEVNTMKLAINGEAKAERILVSWNGPNGGGCNNGSVPVRFGISISGPRIGDGWVDCVRAVSSK